MEIEGTSSYGTVVSTAKGACAACGGIHSVLTRPLIGNVNSINIFLVLGVFLISSLIWSRILAHIKA